MAEIRLFNRTALPPSRSAGVKPSFSLADRSGQIGAGQSLAKFSGDSFNKLVQTRAANEEAAFRGEVKTAMAKWDVFVAAHPAAGYDELQIERNKMMSAIKTAGQKATTGIGKRANARWYAANENVLFAKTQASMESIRAKQELLTYEAQQKNNVVNFDRPAYTTSMQNMIDSGFLDKDFAKARQEFDFAVMDEGEKKLGLAKALSNVETQVFAVAASEGYPAAEAMLREPEIMTQLLESGVSRQDARSLLNDINERVKHDRALADEKLEAAREVDRSEVYDAISAGEIKLPDGSISTDIRKFIESTSLDEDEQDAMWQKSIKETERKLKGEDIITVPQVRTQLYKDIMGILTGAETRDDVLTRANDARFGDYSNSTSPIDPTLNDVDYKAVVNAANAQYEQGYGQMMAKVNDYAEGILLKTDSLGFVKNAPVRHKQMGDFQEAWLQWIASKGDTLKLSELYPEGRRLAATFQISDEEAFRREEVVDAELKQREKPPKTKPVEPKAAGGPPKANHVRMRRPPLREGLDPVIFQVPDNDVSAKLDDGWTIIGSKQRKKLTPQIARRYLDMANSNVEEAKRLAAEDGYRE